MSLEFIKLECALRAENLLKVKARQNSWVYSAYKLCGLGSVQTHRSRLTLDMDQAGKLGIHRLMEEIALPAKAIHIQFWYIPRSNRNPATAN